MSKKIMNSLSFYNEYMTMSEREIARQHGQNIPEPEGSGKKIKLEEIILTPEMRKEWMFWINKKDFLNRDKNLNSLSNAELVKKGKEVLFRDYVSFYSKDIENKSIESRFLFVKNSMELFEKYDNLVHSDLFKIYALLTNKPQLFKNLNNIYKHSNKFLFGIISENSLIGISDLYCPDPDYVVNFYKYCPTGNQIKRNFGAQLNKHNINYDFFKRLNNRRPTIEEIPSWLNWGNPDDVNYDPFTGDVYENNVYDERR